MKVVSFNVRGTGSRLKGRAVRELVGREQIDLLFLQETKAQNVDIHLCRSLWGEGDCEWQALLAVNRAGGLICRKGVFSLSDVHMGTSFIALVVCWENLPQQCVIVNIYSSSSFEEKRAQLRELVEWKSSLPNIPWCIEGDFNAIRSNDEGRGCASSQYHGGREMSAFNNFIVEMELLDIPLHGRKFTWIRPNGSALSRLDRFFMNHEWLELWPLCCQTVLNRDVSDHCPLMIL